MNANVMAMQAIFNNNIQRNQNFYNNMHNNANNLYIHNFNQTWNNMQPNIQLNNTNMNNMLNILSLINFPVLVPFHSQHPLVNCYTPDRAKQYGNWICDICGGSYTYNVPSFFCTACNFDACQKCFISLGAYQIVIYNYLMGSTVQPNEQFKNTSCINLKIHNHPMVKIKRERTHFSLDLKCNICIKNLHKDEEFFYCCLCNYCVCDFCYQSLKGNFGNFGNSF